LDCSQQAEAMNLIDVHEQFATDEQCLAYLEQMRWPKGVRCVTCGNDKLSKVTRDKASKGKNQRVTFYQCLEPTCKKQFSPTAGTIFHDSHLPLHKWFLALALIVDAKKGMSAKQLQRHLGIGGYRTAWYLAHRIRKAMEESEGSLLTGTVEVDETYVGGKQKGRQFSGRSSEGTDVNSNKRVVIGLRQRGGPVRMVHAKDATSQTIGDIIKAHVDPNVTSVMTDEFRVYPKALILAGIHGSKHKTIRHKNNIYVDGDIHTNTVENAFSLFKRGIAGNFHKVSIKHLHRYISEFERRFNRRDDGDIFEQTMARMVGVIPMPYAELIGREKGEAL
jgi:transposase-like protein